MVAGRAARARELCRRALAAAEALGPPAARAIADLHVRLAELDLDAGDLAAAGQHLEIAGSFGEREPTSEGRHRWFVASALLAAARGQVEDALALLDTADEYYRPGFYPNVRPIAAVRARVWIDAGDLARAAEWALDSGVATADEASYLREYEHLTLVRLVLARAAVAPESLTGAVDLLRRLEQSAGDSERTGSLEDIRALLVLAGETQAAGGAAVEARGPAAASPDALTERELQVLRLLDSELTGPQIARELFVSHNTLRTHTKHIFTKLGVATRRAAVARARENGLM
jgi:LuxR family maltose regulon positive regulatory protein